MENDNNDRPDSIYEHGGRPNLKFYGAKKNSETPFFGIELETENTSIKNRNYIADNLPDYIYCQEDSSLGDEGLEITFHPATYQWLKDNKKDIIDKVLDFAIKNKATSYDTSTCGIHIHISRKGLRGTWHLYRLLKLFYDNPHFILKISRRKTDQFNQWCRIAETESGLDIIQKAKTKNGKTRYEAINLTSYETIEFRIFRGTLNKTGFFRNIDFVQAALEFTEKTQTRDISLLNFKNYCQNSFKDLYTFIERL
jgi:hypothetical protein